jgi:predicted RNA binding protein YcfA (HicA-like mRNA interferase family)
MRALAGLRYCDIVRRLRALGLEFHREAAGSHEIRFNPALNRYTTIPNHPGDMPEGGCARSSNRPASTSSAFSPPNK